MITCHLKYVIDPSQLASFEEYGRRWIKLVNRFGGRHHGYFMPSEGASNIAYALFSFPGLAEYETYRKNSFEDDECKRRFSWQRKPNASCTTNGHFCGPFLNKSRLKHTINGTQLCLFLNQLYGSTHQHPRKKNNAFHYT